jgi:hypothetical protein
VLAARIDVANTARVRDVVERVGFDGVRAAFDGQVIVGEDQLVI